MMLEPRTSQLYFLLDRLEQRIAEAAVRFGERNGLRDACEYVLRGKGKRFRPLVVLCVAEALGGNMDVIDAAVCVEFFHVASLVIDDLPCMDNADERRHAPTVHKVYGDSVAILASYALTCAAFERIFLCTTALKESILSDRSDRIGMLALEQASRSAGILGAVGGQFYDLFPAQTTLSHLRDVIYRKTITLFETAFVLGWLFGGGCESELESVKQCAYHWGMAFQISDDLYDVEQDEHNHRAINLVRHIGKDRARAVFLEELRLFTQKLAQLSLDTPSFGKLTDLLRRHAGAL